MYDFSGEFHKITALTLLVWGDKDSIIPKSEQDAYLAAIAGSHLVVYEGTEHAVHWEKPERFTLSIPSSTEYREYGKLGGFYTQN
jgi:non-heme chloroperoxidase